MTSLIERALAGEAVERPPVWFMRQAGRYMAEYRAVREKVSFLELCADPDLACQVTLQPVDRFDVDAAIVFSDILPVLQAIGREITFGKGMGPQVPEPVRTAADLATLRRPDVTDALPVVPETLRRFRKARPDVPIFGFAGAPFTLLCYLVEGGSSKSWRHTKSLLWSDPDTAQALLDLLADVVGDYLQAQVDAGAVAVQIFDTWAGILDPDDWGRWSAAPVARALSRVKGAPRIYYSRGSGPFLHRLHETGADGFSIDWRVDMARARQALGAVPLQGNLDPMLLLGSEDKLVERTKEVLREAAPAKAHIFNLGHGISRYTNPEMAKLMIDKLGQDATQDDATLSAIAKETVAEIMGSGERVPGFGIPLHSRDPRADRVIEIAKENGVYGTYCRFTGHLGDAITDYRNGRPVPLNIDGVCACIALDLGFDWRTTQMFLLTSRSVSMGAHYLEELSQDTIWRHIPADQIEYSGAVAKDRETNS